MIVILLAAGRIVLQAVIMRNLWSTAGFVVGPYGLPQFVGTAVTEGHDDEPGSHDDGCVTVSGGDCETSNVDAEGAPPVCGGSDKQAHKHAACTFADILGDEPSAALVAVTVDTAGASHDGADSSAGTRPRVLEFVSC